MSHAGFTFTYLHGPLRMFSPGVYNYLALEKIYGMLILQICVFSPPELYVVYLKKSSHQVTKGGGGAQAPQDSLATPLLSHRFLHFNFCSGVTRNETKAGEG